MAEVKITKAMVLEAVKAMVSGEQFDTEVTNEDIIAYCDTTLEQLANKNEKAKERAAAKRAEGDALREAVKAVLTDELQTRDQIFAQVEGDDLTINKVGARLTQLVASGDAVKEEVKTESGKKMAYKLA